MRILPIAVAALLIASTSALAQLYRWVDQDGKVNYTQQPPPPSAKNIQKKAIASGSSSESSPLPYAIQVAAKNFPITLYTSPDCGDSCTQARNALVKRPAPFREISVDDEKTTEELKKLTGRNQVPVLRIGSDLQNGYEEGAFKNALDAAGYPASGPPLSLSVLRKMDPKRTPPKPPPVEQPAAEQESAPPAAASPAPSGSK